MNTRAEKEFLAVYDRDRDAVFRQCLVRTRDRDAAIELMQEAFARTWETLASGTAVESMRAFVFQVARNAAIDYAKKKRPVRESELSDTAVLDTVFAQEEHRDPLAETLDRELLRVLDALSDGDREVLTLRYTEGLAVREIARIRGESPGAVSVRIHRALEKIRSRIA